MTRPDPRTRGTSRSLPHHIHRLHHTTRNGRQDMLFDPSLARVIHAERATSWAAESAAMRLLDRPPRRSVRQRVGRSMVRIGARLAAEPSLEPARSR